MPRLYAPAGRTGIIHSRNTPHKVFHIDENGMVFVEAHDDISDLIAAGFSYSPVPKAAALQEIADVAEADAKAASLHADEKAETAREKRASADQAHADAQVAHVRSAEEVDALRLRSRKSVSTPDPKPGERYASETGIFTVKEVDADAVHGVWDDGKETIYSRHDMSGLRLVDDADKQPSPASQEAEG